MTRARIRPLLAGIAVAAILSYGLSGHGLPQMSTNDGMAGAAAGLCLLLIAVLGWAATPKPVVRRTAVVTDRSRAPVCSPPPQWLDGSARASPSALQRFRN